MSAWPSFLIRQFARNRRAYWRGRQLLSTVGFRARRLAFGVRYDVKGRFSNYLATRDLFGSTGRTIVAALVLAIVLQQIDSVIAPLYPRFGIEPPADSDYVAYLVGIGALGGVFIGLYYAGLSAAIGAVYARVPSDVRNLLSQEKTGSTYLRFLAFVTFWAFALVGLRLLHFPKVVIALPVITICTGIGVIAFVRLGQRAFALFDPTTLSRSIFANLSTWVSQVVAGAFRWDDPPFQQHAYRQAASGAETLETLADVSLGEKHLSGKSSSELAKGIAQFLFWYEAQKPLIPTLSAWYEAAYEHADWYKSDDTRIATALQTGTYLVPNTVRKHRWLEDKLLPILNRTLLENIRQRRYGEALDLVQFIDGYCRVLAHRCEPKTAFSVAFSYLEAAIGAISEIRVDDRSSIEVIGLIEQLAMVPVSISIECRKSLPKFSAAQISQNTRSLDWRKAKNLYVRGFDTFSLETLEWLRPRLINEIAIEGGVISPSWYVEELVRQVYANRLAEMHTAIGDDACDGYRQIGRALAQMQHPWMTGAVVSREWEYWHKVEAASHELQTAWSSLTVEKRIDGLNWPAAPHESLQKALRARRKELLGDMSRQIPLLDRENRTSYPDYAGQFLSNLGEACLGACVENDVETLKALFGNYLRGCFTRYQQLLPSVGAGWRTQYDIRVAASAILDVMDLSGYSKLLAEYHNSPLLWKMVTAAWGRLIVRFPGVVQLLPLVTAISKSGFGIAPRGILRSQWHIRINSILAALPTRITSGPGISSHEEVDHPSALVRIFGRRPYGSFHDGVDIFIALYLRKWPPLKDADFGVGNRDLLKQLRHEIARAR